jgi:hypothetical protein
MRANSELAAIDRRLLARWDEVTLPENPEEVTVDWLNRILERSPNWEHGSVIDARLEQVGGDDSLGSTAMRIESKTRRGGKVSLLAKLHDYSKPKTGVGGYANEVLFYREYAGRSGAPVPATHFAAYDPRSGRMAIVQDFLQVGRVGSSSESLSLDELRSVLEVLARMHARWWNSPNLASDGRLRHHEKIFAGGIERMNDGRMSVPYFRERFGHLVDVGVRPIYDDMPACFERMRGGHPNYFTLVHLDVCGKNLFIPDSPCKRPVLFDWSLFARSPVGFELATLLGYSMAPEEHGQAHDLIRYYHRQLVGHGAVDYSLDELWNEFRRACIWRLASPVANASRKSEAGDAFVRELVPRLCSIVIATGALDLVE